MMRGGVKLRAQEAGRLTNGRNDTPNNLRGGGGVQLGDGRVPHGSPGVLHTAGPLRQGAAAPLPGAC